MSPFPDLPRPAWMAEPALRCEQHAQLVHWHCKPCQRNLCRECLDEVAGGHLVCATCGAVIAKSR